MDPALGATVYSALFNNDGSKPWASPQYTCSSGNCNWDPVATLGLRSICSNITDRLNYVCHSVKEEGEEGNAYPGTPNCTVSLPVSNLATKFIENTTIATPIAAGSVAPESALVYKNVAISPVQLIAPDGLFNSQFTLGRKWQAVECAFEPVVYSFNATATNGIYHELKLAT